MQTFKIQFLDFTTHAPVADITLEIDVWVQPLYKRPARLDDTPIEGSTTGGQGHRRSGDGGTSTEVLFPVSANAEKIHLHCQIQPDGSTTVTADLLRMYNAVVVRKSEGQLPDAVEGIIAFMNIASGLFNRLVEPNKLLLFRVVKDGRFAYDQRHFIILIDRGTAILGHTTPTSTQLWFQVFGNNPQGNYKCILRHAGIKLVMREIPLSISSEKHFTQSIFIDRLSPSHAYAYTLYFTGNHTGEGVGPDAHIILSGSFTTPPTENTVSEFLFASCNKPVDADSPFDLWERVAREKDYEFLLLIGDQIYDDGVEENDAELDDAFNMDAEIGFWEEQYLKNYNYFWRHPAIRKVFRNKPVYMMHDDHEVVDDYGVRALRKSKFDYLRFPQEDAALKMVRLFEQPHNPGGLDPRTDELGKPIFDFGFEKDVVAFYTLNTRSDRPSIDPHEIRHPVLGTPQYNRLRDWADSDAVQNADVIFLSIPIPFVYLPSQLIDDILQTTLGRTVLVASSWGKDVYNKLDNTSLGQAGIPGQIIEYDAAILAGIVGGIAGFFGWGDDDAIESAEQELDLKDSLAYGENRKDLQAILDILFELMEGRTRIAKNRAVFILTGDVHVGGFHTILKRSGPHFERGILQITSSGIGHSASPTEEAAEDYASTIEKWAGWLINDLVTAAGSAAAYPFGATYRTGPDTPAIRRLSHLYKGLLYPLESDSLGATYFGHAEDMLMERNIGRVKINRLGGRKYQFFFTVEGQHTSLEKALEVDLDQAEPVYRDLLGGTETAKGHVTLLRLSETGDSYGTSATCTSDEVIIQLDSVPDLFFHLPLHRNYITIPLLETQVKLDDDVPFGRATLELLQDAQLHDRTVTIDYIKQSFGSGKIIRIY